MTRVRWVRRWGQHVVLISVAGDEHLVLTRGQAWKLVHQLTALLLTSPVHRPDNDQGEH